MSKRKKIDSSPLTKTQKSVLTLVVKKLNNNKIPYLISGGLAAIFYGATRKLYDIDIEVRKNDINKIRNIFKKNIFKDFYHLQDKDWDIYLLTLKFKNVPVDINCVEDFYMISGKGKRIKLKTDLKQNKIIKKFGVNFFVEPKRNLIDYKLRLGRKTDLQDVAAIAKF